MPDPTILSSLSTALEGVVAKARPSVKTRKVAILAAKGADAASIKAVKDALAAEGAHAKVIAPVLGTLDGGVEVAR